MWKKMELVVIILMIAGLLLLSRNIREYVSSNVMELPEKAIVIDPGHGGIDPGKIGINDALEKDINLQIAKRVEKLLEKEGVYVFMTRDDDETLAKDNSDNKKREDMQNRVEFIERVKPELVVSIHQNSYTDASVCGAQVFYYTDSAEAKEAAEMMQKALIEVDNNNKRQAKANDSYYLLKRTSCPVIIVECGFLSNPVEADKLITEEYQQKIAEAIVKGITNVV